MRLLSFTRSGQLIFLSLSNFSNENCSLREVTRFCILAYMADMARIRAILLSVCTEELAEYEYECESDSDMVEEFLPFFLLEVKFKSRERAVRIQGYAEEVVPNYSLSTFREHFRLTPETFEELVCELGNCPEILLGHSHGGRPPISIDKQLLIFLWFLGTQECVR